MKNFLSKLWSLSRTDRVRTLAIDAVLLPSFCRVNMLKLVSVLVILLTIGSGNVWSDTWTRVTSVDQITDGGTFIIGYEATAKSGVLVPLRAEGGTATTSAAGLIYAGTTSNSSTNGTIDMSSVTSTTDYEVTIVAGASSGTVSIKLSDNNFIGNDNTKNKVKLYSSVCDNTSFTPTIGTNDVVTLELENGSDTYPYLQYNKTTNQERFCCYNGGQQNVVLYKKGASVKRTVTWMVNGSVYSAGSPTEEVNDGSKVTTLPTAPNPASYCGAKFMGWTTTDIGSTGLDRTSDAAAITALGLFSDAEHAPTVSGGNVTYYAVFADEE